MKFKLHIVEDNAIKAGGISSFFADKYPSSFSTSVFGSFQSALRAMEGCSPDLIVLDMTLPTFDRMPNGREGRMRPLGGYDLMHKMQHRSLKSKVIVVTQLETFGEGDEQVSFAEITARCGRDFPEFFLGSVYYDQSGLNWQFNLTTFVQTFLNQKEKA